MAHVAQSAVIPVPYELVSMVLVESGTDLITPEHGKYSIALGATQLSRDVVTRVEPPFETVAEPLRYTAIHFEIQDRRHPQAFPKLEADLQAIPRPDGNTDISVDGWYEPPTRSFGDAIDAAGMSRLARPAIRRHFKQILGRLEDASQRRLQMLGESH